jgi:hypothetical protein
MQGTILRERFGIDPILNRQLLFGKRVFSRPRHAVRLARPLRL